MKKFTKEIYLTDGTIIAHQSLHNLKFAFKHRVHPIKSNMIELLSEAEYGLTVQQLENKTGIEQSVVSQHLSPLRKYGVVSYQQEGKCHVYKLEQTGLQAIDDMLAIIAKAFPEIEDFGHQQAFVFMNILSHSFRLDVIQLLIVNETLKAGDIYRNLRTEQSWSSSQTRYLIDMKIVKEKRQGKFIMNSVDEKLLKRIKTGMNKYFAVVGTNFASNAVRKATA